MEQDKPTCSVDGCSNKAHARGLCTTDYVRQRRAGTLDALPSYSRNEGKTCNAPDCEEPAKLRGCCRPHYRALRRHGALVDPAPRATGAEGCKVDGCDLAHLAHGYCSGHYQRFRRDGDPGPAALSKRRPRSSCRGPECEKPVRADGLCDAHHWQISQGKELTPTRSYKSKSGECEVSGCGRKRESEGLCQTHYRRKIAGEGDWDSPVKERGKSGTGHTDKQGYRIITVNYRTVREHRWIAEQILGRGLLPTEDVHHVDADRSNNATDGPFVLDERGRLRSGNLEIWLHEKHQPRGCEVGPRLERARQLLALYGTTEERGA